MQWLDTEQSDFNKSYVEGEARDAREGGSAWLSGKRERGEKGVERNVPSSGDDRT
jgi:hypothetical protein